MKSLIRVGAFCLVLVLVVGATAHAAPVFVATAKNLRGALYLGYGPTPAHASEIALAKCSQNSFIPPTCRVLCVRMEVPPPLCLPPMPKKSIRKYKPKTYPTAHNPYARPYNSPMPYGPR